MTMTAMMMMMLMMLMEATMRRVFGSVSACAKMTSEWLLCLCDEVFLPGVNLNSSPNPLPATSVRCGTRFTLGSCCFLLVCVCGCGVED